MADAIGEQRLNEALSLMIIRDHGGVAGMGRIDERWNPARLAVIPQHHGSQIEPRSVWRRKLGHQPPVNFDLFPGEFQVVRVKLCPFFGQCRCHRHGPERGNARKRKLGGLHGWFFRHENSLRLNGLELHQAATRLYTSGLDFMRQHGVRCALRWRISRTERCSKSR